MWAPVCSNNKFMAAWFLMSYSKDRAPIQKLVLRCNVWDWESAQAGVLETGPVCDHVHSGCEWLPMTSGYEMTTGVESPSCNYELNLKHYFTTCLELLHILYLAQNAGDTRKGTPIKWALTACCWSQLHFVETEENLPEKAESLQTVSTAKTVVLLPVFDFFNASPSKQK